MINKITTLNHETFDNAMKNCAFVTEWKAAGSVLTTAKLSEIFNCPWSQGFVELHFYSTDGRRANRDVKETNNVPTTESSIEGCVGRLLQ